MNPTPFSRFFCGSIMHILIKVFRLSIIICLPGAEYEIHDLRDSAL